MLRILFHGRSHCGSFFCTGETSCGVAIALQPFHNEQSSETTPQLIHIAQTAQPTLNDDKQLEQRTTELQEKLHQLKIDNISPLLD